jgi:VIT1/CCC1 family predicted Fe2+/Mn2+ transporter
MNVTLRLLLPTKRSIVDSKLRVSLNWAWGILMKLPGRVLEPVERISEILFGLIMALTITGAVSVATADHIQIRTMLFAALGCNLAWGIIDGGMYLMARLGERGRNAVIARQVREAANPEDAHRIIVNELPPLLESIFELAQLELIRERTIQMRASNFHPTLTGREWLGALGIFILVALSTFPVVIPFIVFEDARIALRTSNALAVILLFVCGFLFARHAGLWPVTTGVIMVVIGAALVSVAIALGG